MSDGHLQLVPISIRDANRYVARWHRKLKPKRGALFALAATRGGLEPVGVAIVGRPNARLSQDGLTCEVLRVATPGVDATSESRNVCSFLYARCKRAAQALGYQRGVTMTRVDESGASLRAIGLTRPTSTDDGEEWDRPSRPRTRKGGHQLVTKHSWTLWDDREPETALR